MPKNIDFKTDPRFVRRAREIRTIEVMISRYCRGHGHAAGDSNLCSECASLAAYATRRTERCVFGDAKPTCANCLVHCYTPRMRERVKVVMRWAGPRMLLSHPVLALRHKLDGLKPAPRLPAAPRAGAKT